MLYIMIELLMAKSMTRCLLVPYHHCWATNKGNSRFELLATVVSSVIMLGRTAVILEQEQGRYDMHDVSKSAHHVSVRAP